MIFVFYNAYNPGFVMCSPIRWSCGAQIRKKMSLSEIESNSIGYFLELSWEHHRISVHDIKHITRPLPYQGYFNWILLETVYSRQELYNSVEVGLTGTSVVTLTSLFSYVTEIHSVALNLLCHKMSRPASRFHCPCWVLGATELCSPVLVWCILRHSCILVQIQYYQIMYRV